MVGVGSGMPPAAPTGATGAPLALTAWAGAGGATPAGTTGAPTTRVAAVAPAAAAAARTGAAGRATCPGGTCCWTRTAAAWAHALLEVGGALGARPPTHAGA